MRHGRAKAARKTLQFFHRTIGLKPPYHLILDGTFIVAVVKYNLPLLERLDRLLQHAPLQLCITESALIELEKLQANVKQNDKVKLIQEAHKWAKDNCHKILLEIPPNQEQVKNSILVDAKVWDKLSNAGRDVLCLVAEHNKKDAEQRYFVASQDEELLNVLRRGMMVPIIRLARGSVLLLEQPSKAANQQASQQERQKWSLAASITDQEKSLVEMVKERQQQQHKAARPAQPVVRRKRKAKGPNPLSCKKKKSKTNISSKST